MLVALKTFAPDAEPADPGVLLDCEGFMPTERGLRTAPTPVDAGITAAAATAHGAATIEKSDGTKALYLGTATKLYIANGTEWDEATRTAGGNRVDYTLGASSTWDFAVFGSEVYAGSADATLQRMTAGAFADVTAGPKAAILEPVGLFMMAFDVNDGSGFDHDDGWWTSAQSNAASWTVSVASGSVRGRLYATPGPILAAKSLGEQTVAYKASGVYLGTNVGPPVWWAWQLMPGDAGAVGKWAVAQIQVAGAPAHFIVGPRAMYVFDGTRPITIGEGLVRRWFYSRLHADYGNKTACVVDRSEGCVFILFANEESAGELNDCLIYSYKTNRWGRGRDYDARFGLQYIAPSATFDSIPADGVTFEDVYAPSYDELFRDSGLEAPAIVTIGNTISTLNGGGSTSSFRTGYAGVDGAVSFVKRVRPRFLSAPDSASLVLRVADSTADTASEQATATLANNRFDVLGAARWHSFSVATVGACELSALDVEVKVVSQE